MKKDLNHSRSRYTKIKKNQVPFKLPHITKDISQTNKNNASNTIYTNSSIRWKWDYYTYGRKQFLIIELENTSMGS